MSHSPNKRPQANALLNNNNPHSNHHHSNIAHNQISRSITLIERLDSFHNNPKEDKIGRSIQDFEIINELGKGASGVVYKVKSLKNEEIYCMKKINIKNFKNQFKGDPITEAQILKKVKHPNIIRYHRSFINSDYLYIIMEYAEGGDLQKLIRARQETNAPFTEKEIWKFAIELGQAIHYLHNNHIIHRDIKTLNVFLTKENQIKLGDLGFSRIISDGDPLKGARVGTPLYLAPELITMKPYDYKVDVWALGCVLYHLAALESPFSGDNFLNLGYNIVHKCPKKLPSHISSKLSCIIFKMLEKLSTHRPTINSVLELLMEKKDNPLYEGMVIEDEEEEVFPFKPAPIVETYGKKLMDFQEKLLQKNEKIPKIEKQIIIGVDRDYNNIYHEDPEQEISPSKKPQYEDDTRKKTYSYRNQFLKNPKNFREQNMDFRLGKPKPLASTAEKPSEGFKSNKTSNNSIHENDSKNQAANLTPMETLKQEAAAADLTATKMIKEEKKLVKNPFQKSLSNQALLNINFRSKKINFINPCALADNDTLPCLSLKQKLEMEKNNTYFPNAFGYGRGSQIVNNNQISPKKANFPRNKDEYSSNFEIYTTAENSEVSQNFLRDDSKRATSKEGFLEKSGGSQCLLNQSQNYKIMSSTLINTNRFNGLKLINSSRTSLPNKGAIEAIVHKETGENLPKLKALAKENILAKIDERKEEPIGPRPGTTSNCMNPRKKLTIKDLDPNT